MGTALTGFILFIIALATSVLLIRWRTRVATQKLLAQPMPNIDIGLPFHPDGVLLLFHHPRCGPCRQAVKQFEYIASVAPQRVLKVNVGETLDLAQAFTIRATPTILFIKNNAIDAAFVGAASLQKLLTLLNLES